MVYNYLCEYLRENGINDFTKFCLDAGIDGTEYSIVVWDYDIAKPDISNDNFIKKYSKISNLEIYYKSNECWAIVVSKDNYSVDNKTCNWWRDEAGSIVNGKISGKIAFTNSKNQIAQIEVNPELAATIIAKQLEIRQSIFLAYTQAKELIKSNPDFDIQDYFAKVNKTININ